MDPDLPAVLLMGGGEGMGPVKKTAMALGEALYDKEAEKPIGQMVIICGRNKNLVSTLESFEWKIPVKDERGVMPPNSEVVAAPASVATATSHGIEGNADVASFKTGKVSLDRIQNSFFEGDNKRITYLGDGTGDYCPSLRLKERDFMMPRKNFPVWHVTLLTLLLSVVPAWI